MKTYSLTIGLVIRDGQRTFRFERESTDETGALIIFLDQHTGALRTFRPGELQRAILAGRIEVLNDIPVSTLGDAHSSQTFVVPGAERPRRLQELALRTAYVRHMRRLGLTHGQRGAIEKALAKLAGQHPNPHGGQAGLGIEITESFRVPSSSSVMRWMQAFDASGRNVAALLNGHARRKATRRIQGHSLDIARRLIKSFYLQRARPTVLRTTEEINDEIARQKAKMDEATKENSTVRPLSYATVRRLIDEVPKFDQDAARYGLSYANNKWRHSLNGVSAARIMQRYEIDHTILDIVVIHDLTGMPLGRPTITIVVDAAADYVVGLHISFWGTGLASTFSALKHAILPKDEISESLGLKFPWLSYGIPELIVVDNGLEFHSKHFHAAAMLLDMDVLYCKVRQPWLKPFAEGALRKLNYHLPMEGRVEKPLNNYLPINPDKTACIPFSQLCTCLVKQFIEVHHMTPHNTKLVRPFDVYQEGLQRLLPPRIPASTREMEIVASIGHTRVISGEGVNFEYLRFNSTALAELRRKVGTTFQANIKASPDTLDYVYVQSPLDNTWLQVGSAMPDYTTGLSLVQHRAIRAMKKDILNKKNAYEVLAQGRRELNNNWASAVNIGKRLKANHVRALESMSSSRMWRSEPSAAIPQAQLEIPDSYVPSQKFDSYMAA